VPVLVATVVVAGCSKDAATPGKVANPPEDAIAAALGQHGARVTMVPAADVATLVTVILGTIGLDGAQRACAAPGVVATLNPAANGDVALSSIGKFVGRLRRDDSTPAKAVAACATPDWTTRRDAGPPAADRDLTGLMDAGKRLSIAEANGLGFTDAEATCFASALLDPVRPEDLASSISGLAKAPPAKPRPAIDKCVTPERQMVIVAKARTDEAAYQDCSKQQSDAIARAIAEQTGSSTTTPAPDRTTTTFARCV